MALGSFKTGFWVAVGVLVALIVVGLLAGFFVKG
jgi:hypothetical protein